MSRFSRAHYQMVSPPADTPRAIVERIRAREAANLGLADRIARFPVLTPENAQEAIDYQAERIAFHLRAMTEAAP